MPPELLAQQLASLSLALEEKPGSIEPAVNELTGLIESARRLDLSQPELSQLQRELARFRLLVESGRVIFDEWAARLCGDGYTPTGERRTSGSSRTFWEG